MLIDHRRLIPLKEKEIAALIVHKQRMPLQDPVGIHDNIALAGLPEHMLQHDRVKSLRLDQILQDTARPDTGKLIHIPHQDQTGSLGHRLQKSVKEIHIHHGHLIYNDDIRLQGVILPPLKPVISFFFVSSSAARRGHILPVEKAFPVRVIRDRPDPQQTMNRHGWLSGRLRHAPGSPPCRGSQKHIQTILFKKTDDGIDRSRLTRSGTARNHQDRVFRRLQNCFPLQRIQSDMLLFFQTGDLLFHPFPGPAASGMPVNTDIQIQQHSGDFLLPAEKPGQIHLDSLRLPCRTAAGSLLIIARGNPRRRKTLHGKIICRKSFRGKTSSGRTTSV